MSHAYNCYKYEITISYHKRAATISMIAEPVRPKDPMGQMMASDGDVLRQSALEYAFEEALNERYIQNFV